MDMVHVTADAGSSSGSSSVAAAGQRENLAAPRPRSEEEERRRKGTMPTVEQQSMPLPPPVPVEGKLMGDAIRANALASASTPFVAWKDVPFDYGAVSPRLRDALEDLGVVAGAGPVCVYEKKMANSDRQKEQNRLLISCKDAGGNNGGGGTSKKRKKDSGGGTSKGGNKKMKNNDSGGNNGGGGTIKGGRKKDSVDERCAAANFKKIFSDKEIPIVELQQPEKKQEEEEEEEEGMTKAEKKKREKEEPGLDLQVFDRDGEMYELKCRFLQCNQGYRLIGKHWTRFLVKTGLLVKKKKKRKGSPEAEGSEGGESSSPSPEPDEGPPEPKVKVRPARLELWAFRSPKLTMGCPGHADGKLGLVLLHYFEGDGAEAERVDAGGRVSADEPEPRGSEEEDAMEPAMPNAGDEMAIDEPNVVPADAHVDEVPVMEAGEPDEDEDVAMANVGAAHVPVPPVVAGAHEEDANEGAVAWTEADERMRELEAAEAMLLLRQRSRCMRCK
ncbi:hypothetical protein ZWY2020_031181 [Hordeum vulgare]|nr:hypothetical protein ZWY2020_031181 [Hordeum vulgare]